MRQALSRSFCLGLFALSSTALQAYSFRCEKDQTRCEIQTRRLTIGDKIGIFQDGEYLVGLGEVVDIRGDKRIVKVTQRWTMLLKSHDMQVITDEAYTNPEASYKIVTPLPPLSWAAQLGLSNLGVGDGMMTTEVSGLLYKHFWRDLSYMGRFHFLTGSGSGTDNLGGAGKQDFSATSFGLSGGISELLMPFSPVSVRLDGELGFSYGNISVSGGYDEGRVLNDRMKDGIGVYLRGGANAIWRRDGIQPEAGISFLHIHNANGAVLSLGINRSLK